MSDLARIVLMFALVAAAPAATERSLAAENWAALKKLNAEEVAAFAEGLDAKDGSLEAEVRTQAFALARKLDPTLKPKEPAKKPMAAEDQLADKTTRDAAAQRDQAREAAEKSSPPPAPGAREYPKPESVRERFDALRFEVLSDEADFLASLSANPEARAEAALRLSAVKEVEALLGAPKWACEKSLKERLKDLGAPKYAPWNGVWTTRLGEMTLAQVDDKVTGSWKRDAKSDSADGTLQGTIKDRTLTGTWKTAGEQGTFSMLLYRNDRYWKGWTKTKSDTNPLDGTRTGDAPRADGKK